MTSARKGGASASSAGLRGQGRCGRVSGQAILSVTTVDYFRIPAIFTPSAGCLLSGQSAVRFSFTQRGLSWIENTLYTLISFFKVGVALSSSPILPKLVYPGVHILFRIAQVKHCHGLNRQLCLKSSEFIIFTYLEMHL